MVWLLGCCLPHLCLRVQLNLYFQSLFCIFQMNKKTINLSSQGHEAISRISSNLKGDRQKESEIVFNSLLLLFTIKSPLFLH
jgi:hypothetical protein